MSSQLEPAVRAALDDPDAPAAVLALTYARMVDQHPELLPDLGPKLLAALDALLLTPKARAAVLKGGTSDSGRSSPLDELRARRAARQRDPAAVDSAAP